jgi:DNA-directed RNA polymerase specialized sigma24 family protein
MVPPDRPVRARRAVSDDIILECIPKARGLARRFFQSAPIPFHDSSEAEGIALLALVIAAGEYDGRVPFWRFAQIVVHRALVDEVRRSVGRHSERRTFQLDEDVPGRSEIAALEASIDIERTLPFLKPSQRRLIEHDRFGTPIKLKPGSEWTVRSLAIRRMREVLRKEVY